MTENTKRNRAKCPNKLPGNRGRRSEKSTEIPQGVKDLLEEMMPWIEKGYPESTVVQRIGLDEQVWAGYRTRYPALVLAIKKAQAARCMEWQDRVEAGAQGWQAAATLLERRDPANWSRQAPGRPKQSDSPFASASKRRGKS